MYYVQRMRTNTYGMLVVYDVKFAYITAGVNVYI